MRWANALGRVVMSGGLLLASASCSAGDGGPSVERVLESDDCEWLMDVYLDASVELDRFLNDPDTNDYDEIEAMGVRNRRLAAEQRLVELSCPGIGVETSVEVSERPAEDDEGESTTTTISRLALAWKNCVGGDYEECSGYRANAPEGDPRIEEASEILWAGCRENLGTSCQILWAADVIGSPVQYAASHCPHVLAEGGTPEDCDELRRQRELDLERSNQP